MDDEQDGPTASEARAINRLSRQGVAGATGKHRIPAIEDIDVVACLDRDADGNIIVRHGYDGYSTTKTQPWIKKRQDRKKAKQAKASRRANR